MASTLDLRFRVLDTTIRATYSNIAALDAEVLVSADDVHLSMTGGIASAIRAVSGDGPRDDAHKHTTPVPVGAVLVTGGGKLSAKYIFHAVVLGFQEQPRYDLLIPRTAERIVELARMLDARSIATPLIGTGRSGLSHVDALEQVLRSMACALVMTPTNIREVVVALYDDEAEDHALAEAALVEAIVPVAQKVERWADAGPYNVRLALLRALLNTLDPDDTLARAVQEQIADDELALCKLFGCPQHNPGSATMPEEAFDAAVQTQAQFDRALERLTKLIGDLNSEIDHNHDLMRAERRRLQLLEKQQARQGGDTPPHVLLEIDSLRRSLGQRERQAQKLQEQYDAAQFDLGTLQQRWARRSTAR